MVATTIHADLLVLLSDIDGLYTADPHTDPTARRIEVVDSITPEIMALGGGMGSSLGTGGMMTKLRAAERVTEAGIDMVIANGDDPMLLYDVLDGNPVGTLFKGKGTR